MTQDNCPNCGGPIAMEDSSYGVQIECPHCRTRFKLTAPVKVKPQKAGVSLSVVKNKDGGISWAKQTGVSGDFSDSSICCGKCGLVNPGNSYKCNECGVLINQVAIDFADADCDLLSIVFPFQNQRALLSYYFGVFSFLPIIGFFLVYFSVSKGLRGVSEAKKLQYTGGFFHGWAGIAFGVFSVCFQIGLIVYAMWFFRVSR